MTDTWLRAISSRVLRIRPGRVASDPQVRSNTECVHRMTTASEGQQVFPSLETVTVRELACASNGTVINVVGSDDSARK